MSFFAKGPLEWFNKEPNDSKLSRKKSGMISWQRERIRDESRHGDTRGHGKESEPHNDHVLKQQNKHKQKEHIGLGRRFSIGVRS